MRIYGLDSRWIFPILLLSFLLLCSCQSNQKGGKKENCLSGEKGIKDIKEIISSTDVERYFYPDTPVINLYQGNGKFGSSYGPLGLHFIPGKDSKYGKTQFMHLDHWARAKFGADYLLPLAKIYWEENPSGEINNYQQHQSFYDGTITTHFEHEGNKTTVTTWFDPVNQDLAGINIQLEGESPDVLFDPFKELNVHYAQKLLQKTNIRKLTDEVYELSLTCQNVRNRLYLKANTGIQHDGSVIRLKLHPGDNHILISVNQPVGITAEESQKQTAGWWHSKWKSSGLLVLPDSNAQKMWVRSMAQFLSSYNSNQFGIPGPMGFTGHRWPFYFPQDISYILPVLFSTGNHTIGKFWIEHWAGKLSGMKAYTKRLLNMDGIFCPWAFAYGDLDGFHDPAPPNVCYYEIHNSGYLARMAYETAIGVNDEVWTKTYAAPLIDETARFYKSICTKGTDGYWHLYVEPSMGQDEYGGMNQKDYLCTLFSAQYCFQKAIEYNLDTDGSYKTILEEGLAFPSLKSSKGFYFTCAGRGENDFGKQKHPVQLNDLAFLPLSPEVTNSTSTVYKLRYEITDDAKTPEFHGWTLGEFLLASARIGDVDGWKKDWANLRKADVVDPEWIQVYESSFRYDNSYYTTTNGLICQSLLNGLISDWFGKLEIAKCNPWQEEVLVKDIYSLLGVKISGKIMPDFATLYLTAWRDCSFQLLDKTIKMKKDEEKEVQINLKTKQVISQNKID